MAKNEAMARFQRQGDVGLTQVANLPDGLKPREGNALAYGEVTGHAHKIFPADPSVEVALMEDKSGSLYVNVKGELGAYLYHGTDEQIARQRRGETVDYEIEDVHAPQFLPSGTYAIDQQEEYDFYEEAMRQVAD